MRKFTADFETATWLEDETFVWAWALCEIDNPDNIRIGNNIDSFMKILQTENILIYFHNLRFDGEFILHWLLKNGYEHIEDRKERRDKTFMTLISDMGLFYSIEIYFKVDGYKVRKITIYDSMKIIPFAVDDMPKHFGLDIEKLEIDYNQQRSRNHTLTKQEEEYIKNDVKIVAESLKIMFSEGLTKMTIGSNALQNFKKGKGFRTFNDLFPSFNLELYEDIRNAYRGGFTYLNPIYKDKENKTTIGIDVNSLYPSCMVVNPMPYGDPKFFEGEYKKDKNHPLYIQRLTCSFEIKKDKIPTIQLKNHRFFLQNEYLESSNGEIVALTLTNVDLELFLEHYDVYDLDYICGWKFKSMYGIFDDYIYYWIKQKNDATISGNKGKRTIAKLLLNSLYGKFATSMRVQEKIPYLDNDRVLYKLSEEKEKEGLYLPIGCFITSWARDKTIRTCQKVKDYSIKKYGEDKFIYADTDSCYTTLSIEELKELCEIDDVKLGAWKHETTAKRSKFIRQKTYLKEVFDEKENEWVIDITCAGLPKDCYKYVEWEKFKEGFTCGGKLTFKHVKGGVKLVETDFTLKSSNMQKVFKDF